MSRMGKNRENDLGSCRKTVKRIPYKPDKSLLINEERLLWSLVIWKMNNQVIEIDLDTKTAIIHTI